MTTVTATQARQRHSEAELEAINERLVQVLGVFGQPHHHAGLGLRHLRDNAFEFRISNGLRVVFLFFMEHKDSQPLRRVPRLRPPALPLTRREPILPL